MGLLEKLMKRRVECYARERWDSGAGEPVITSRWDHIE
jgi:hypothetical protein